MADPISAGITAIVTAASSAAASAALAVTGSATLAAAAGNAVIGLASWQTALSLASFAASALLTPKVEIEGSPIEWRADVSAGVPFVLGRRAVSGSIVHRDEWGNANHYQSIWTVYSGGGPISAFEQFYLDDVAVDFNGANGEASTSGFQNKAWLQTVTGTASPTALAQTGLAKDTPTYEGWTGASTLPYRAASMLTLFQDRKAKNWPAGEPNKRVTIRGLLCYDPRLDSTVAGGSGTHRADDPSTWAYSENAALCGLKVALGIYEGSKLVGGIGAGVDGVDIPAFMEWANICDANGWVVSGYFTSKDDQHQTLQACLQAGGARYARKGGKISVITRTAKTSVLTINADDTAGAFELVLHADRLAKVNTIIPSCAQESLEWEVTPQPEVQVASYVTDDGGVLERDLTFPFVAVKASGANKDQPAQLAAYAILDSREPFSGTVPLKPWCADIEPGDVFTITEPGFLLDGVELLCVRRQFDPVSNVVRVTFISESTGKHAFALGLTNTPPTPPTLTAPDLFTVDPPEVGAFSAVAGSTPQPSVIVTADADQDNARAFVIEYRTGGSPPGDWITYGQFDISTTSVTLWGLAPNQAYEIAIRYVSEFGVIGERRSLGNVTTGAITADNLDDGAGGTVGAVEIAAAQAAADAAQAELDAARDTLDSGAIDLSGALTTEQTRINTAVDDARLEGRVQVTRISAPKDNLVLDALFTLGAVDWRLASGGQPIIDERTTPRSLLLEFTAVGAGEAESARLLDEFDTYAGERFELAGEADVVGVATAPVLRVVWLNSAGTSLSTNEIALTDLFTRGGGFVTAPSGVAKMRLEVAVDATGAGDGEARFRRIMWRKADDDQSVISTFSDEDSAQTARLKREIIASADTVAETRRLSVSDGVNFAAIQNIEITQTDGGSALAASISSLEARTATAESEIDDLQTAVVVGNLAQAKDIQSLKISTRGLNAFEDPTFQLGARPWTSTPTPPTIDETGTPRALEVVATTAAGGTVATLVHGDRFRVEPSQGLEAAVDVKFSGTVTSASVKVAFYDDAESLLSTATAGSGGAGTYTRIGGFVTAPASTKYAEFRIEATGTAGAFELRARRPHFGGQADGQTTLTPFDSTLQPRVAEAVRGIEVDSFRAIESLRLSVSDGRNQAEIVEERETRVANEAAFASRLDAVETTANGALPTASFDTFFSNAVASNQLQSQSDVNAAIAAIDLTTYAAFTTVQNTANAALPAADFDSTFAAAAAAANLTSTSDVNSAIAAFDLSLNATFSALSATVDEKANSADVYNQAQADQRFLLQADDGGSLAAYDLTLNAQFSALQNAAAEVVRQASQPTPGNYKAGDIWIDSDDGDALYVHNGAAWVLTDVATEAWASSQFRTAAQVDNAIATYQFTVGATTGTISAQVNANATAITNVDGKLSASYGLTVDANGSIASLKLLSDGTTSTVRFDADTFQVWNGSTGVSPFEVSGGIVRIKEANIGVANIDTLNLKNGAATEVKTAGLSVSTYYYIGFPATSADKRNKANHRTIDVEIEYDNVIVGADVALLVNLVQAAALSAADWLAFEVEVLRVSRTGSGTWSSTELQLFKTSWLRELRNGAYPSTMYNVGAPIDEPYAFVVEDKIPAFATGSATVSPSSDPRYKYIARTKFSYDYDVYSNFDAGHDNAQNNSRGANAKLFTLTGIMSKR